MSLARELGRKAFHQTSLVYWGIYVAVGYPRVVAPLAYWSAFVAFVEIGRLYWSGLNRALMSIFGGVARSEEQGRVSGIFHTSLGAMIVIAGFGSDARVVAASLFCVALGDTASALAGKKWGRHKILGGKKSAEGSLACLATCWLVCRLAGFNGLASISAAAVSTAIELVPTTAWFNDNLWMPAGAAVALSALR